MLLLHLSSCPHPDSASTLDPPPYPRSSVDPTLIPPRLDTVQVPLPDLEARLEFFRLVLQRPELSAAHGVSKADLAKLAQATQGCTGV